MPAGALVTRKPTQIIRNQSLDRDTTNNFFEGMYQEMNGVDTTQNSCVYVPRWAKINFRFT